LIQGTGQVRVAFTDGDGQVRCSAVHAAQLCLQLQRQRPASLQGCGRVNVTSQNAWSAQHRRVLLLPAHAAIVWQSQHTWA
jgi:hypothetical protein